MTNAPEVARELQQRCQGSGGACSRPQGGRHAQCRGETTRMAADYRVKLCRAILVGFRNQLQKNEVCKDGFIGMLESGIEKQELPAVLPCLLLQGASRGRRDFRGRLVLAALGSRAGEGGEEEGDGILRRQACMGIATHGRVLARDRQGTGDGAIG